MRAPPTKMKKRGEHQKQASHDDEDKNKASSKPPSNVRAIGARRPVRVKKKKKRERRKRNKRRNTKPQTKKTRPRTTGKQGMTTKYVTAPCVLHIVSTATHTWMRKPSMLRRRAPKGQHRPQKRTTNRHARQEACPQTQTTTIYPPYLFLHRLRPPRDTRRKKKKTTKAEKIWGGHGQRGTNEKANKRSPPTTGKQRYGEQVC